MATFKLIQTVGAVAVLVAFFLPWSKVNFGATVSKAAGLAHKVVPGGIGALRGAGSADPATQAAIAAGTAANIAAQPGVLQEAKELLTVPTGQFSGLNITLSATLMYLVGLVPLAALLVLGLCWFTPRGTGAIGVGASVVCLAMLLGMLILSFMGGMFKDVQSTMAAGAAVAAAPPPQGLGQAMGLMVKQLMWGFWVAAGGAALMLISSPFAKKSEKA